MPTISVITAVIDGRDQYLGDTYRSLLDQEMPAGWTWQWVVQEDGETGRPLAHLPADTRISTGTGPQGRAAMARTLALSRAEGTLVRALDADDMLPAGALARDITTLIECPDIGWCVSPALDLLPDGSLKPGPRDPDPGPLPPDYLTNGERDGLLQVIGITMCAYTQLVHALGGWQALPGEDVALLLAAEAVAKGWMISEPGLLYRRWPGSSTSERNAWVPSKETAKRRVMLERIRALRHNGWQWRPGVQHNPTSIQTNPR